MQDELEWLLEEGNTILANTYPNTRINAYMTRVLTYLKVLEIGPTVADAVENEDHESLL